MTSTRREGVARSVTCGLVIAVLSAGGLALGCGDRGNTASTGASTTTPAGTSAAPPDASASSSARLPHHPPENGAALLEKYQCARCHDGAGPTPPPEKQCVGCHQEILAGRFTAPPADLARWKKDLVHFRVAPSLENLGHRLRGDFVKAYLEKPFTVRPRLGGTMPRLAITPGEAAVLARHLTDTGEPPIDGPALPVDGDTARGKALYAEKRCADCHAFTGAEPPSTRPPTKDAERMAPDLRFARDRMLPHQIVAWILDPEKIRKGSLMTRLVSTRREAQDLAAYVVETPLVVPTRERPTPPPPLDRPVTYDEVAKRVFKKTCWHCHSQPDYARGDGGAGNTGGFGFAGKRVDLSSYESMLTGYVGDDGQRQSLFSTRDGDPILLRVMFARHLEDFGETGDVRGMPLGIEPVSVDDYRAVARWIADGHPR